MPAIEQQMHSFQPACIVFQHQNKSSCLSSTIHPIDSTASHMRLGNIDEKSSGAISIKSLQVPENYNLHEKDEMIPTQFYLVANDWTI